MPAGDQGPARLGAHEAVQFGGYAVALLPVGRADSRADAREAGRKNMVRKDEVRRAARKVQERAKRRAEEMLGACGRSQRGVRRVLAARLAPDQVPPEVEQEERRRQGLPARDGMARRLVARMA